MNKSKNKSKKVKCTICKTANATTIIEGFIGGEIRDENGKWKPLDLFEPACEVCCQERFRESFSLDQLDAQMDMGEPPFDGDSDDADITGDVLFDLW